ncbi:MAG: DUF805 domain-containing protein [Rickettsiales bacterium]|jgi:uncharacterized membrane protein YhaH (DUF805 family)|nr:DUF805 domain-containing protein [Rickettsiales bacterium]
MKQKKTRSKKTNRNKAVSAAGQVRFVGFSEAVVNFFSKYVQFSGTATRAEYWWAKLFIIITSYVLIFLPPLYIAWQLAIVIPGVSLVWRRMHDIGKPGWWYYAVELAAALVALVFVGTGYAHLDPAPANGMAVMAIAAGSLMALGFVVYLFVLLLTPSKTEDNEYRK